MLGNTQKKNYLNISKGKIVRKTDSGLVQSFDYVEGILERIYRDDMKFQGENVPRWYIDMRDPETGEIHTLGVNASSGVWRCIILSLGSCTDFSKPIRFTAYQKGIYSRVIVHSGENRLEWVPGLPPVEEIQVEGQRVKSVKKREDFILGVVDSVNNALSGR